MGVVIGLENEPTGVFPRPRGECEVNTLWEEEEEDKWHARDARARKITSKCVLLSGKAMGKAFDHFSLAMGNIFQVRKKLDKKEMQFLLRNTNFTEQQIKAWFHGFYHDCPSGYLSKPRFVKVYSSFYPGNHAECFCEQVFRAFDRDNSGKIDFKEFLLAINITASGSVEEKLEWAFKMYDCDDDGIINRAEMKQIIQSIYNMLKNGDRTFVMDVDLRAEDIFVYMDTNNDGSVTKEEFMTACFKNKELCSLLLGVSCEDSDNAN